MKYKIICKSSYFIVKLKLKNQLFYHTVKVNHSGKKFIRKFDTIQECTDLIKSVILNECFFKTNTTIIKGKI